MKNFFSIIFLLPFISYAQNNKIVVDANLMKWVDQTKTFTDKGYNNKTSLWDTTWAKDQGPDGKVFGFFYSTWGINFTLLGNSLATPKAEGGKEPHATALQDCSEQHLWRYEG